jgi:hypothetical protein
VNSIYIPYGFTEIKMAYIMFTLFANIVIQVYMIRKGQNCLWKHHLTVIQVKLSQRLLLARSSLLSLAIAYPKAAHGALLSIRVGTTCPPGRKKYWATFCPRLNDFRFSSPERRRVAQTGQGILTNMFEHVAA